jgi:excisionase family DNA binding protein
MPKISISRSRWIWLFIGVITMQSDWNTINEIAEKYNISKSLVRKLIREQKVKFYRIGRKILIKPNDFEVAIIAVEPVNNISI